MSSIKHFRTELKIKIETLESEFNFLTEQITCSDIGSEEVVRTYLQRLIRRIARKHSIRKAAESVLNQRGHFYDAHSLNSGDSKWIVSTRSRALAAMDVACLVLDEAARAAVEAWLAENVAVGGTAPESRELSANHER